jgi:outer membrane protein TolC
MRRDAMIRLIATSLVLSLLSLFVPIYGSAESWEQDSREATKDKIRKLQRERVDVLHQAVQVALAFYREGAKDFRTVDSVQQDLFEAKLDMAETREEKMAVLRSQLKTAKGWLAVAEEMVQAGRTTVLDVHQARSRILSIEIRLLKLLVMDKSNSRQAE